MPGSRERFITEAELDRILQNYLKRIKAIGGAGDMMKAVYDTDNDGVVDAAETAVLAADSDKVDGEHASAFAPVSHQHGGGDITSQVGDSDKVDGEHAAAFAPAAKGVTNGDLHDHVGGDGAAIVEGALSLSDIATEDVSTSKHGFAPKRDGSAQSFLSGLGTWLKPGMYTLLNEPFDALNTANINEQGSYTNFAAWAVTLIGDTTAKVVVNAGADKMGQLDGDTVTEGTSRCYLITGATWPWGLAFGTRIHVKIRTSDKTVGTKGIQIGGADNADCAQVYFNTVDGGSLAFWNGSSIVSLVNPINNNQWYEVDIFIIGGTTNPYALVFIDGVQMGAPKASRTMSDNWKQVSFYCNTAGTAARINLDFDDLQIGTSWFWSLQD